MRARLEGLAERLVPENPGGVIYGIVAVGALLAAESGEHDSYLDTLASAAIAAALYWVAHAYAELLGQRLAERERLCLPALARALAHDLAIVQGAALPLAAIALAWLAGASQHTAVIAALWSAIASVVAFELMAGVRARASPRELAFDAAVGAGLGLTILALKILLH
ncbi:MAG TPA: hypothetical protein VGY13_08855 [Solirubrobacteraceae bacterium]|jgi:hypothetical protein|nr:hypothetical protein [Solirubrobacteraceae bacterium]